MSYEKNVEAAAKISLIGKKITSARYMTKLEADRLGFESRPFALILEDGTWIVPSRDPEGNGAGTLFTSFQGELETISDV